jgi:hypothetical protein
VTDNPPTLIYSAGKSWIVDEPNGRLERYESREVAKYYAPEPFKLFEDRAEAAEFANNYQMEEAQSR